MAHSWADGCVEKTHGAKDVLACACSYGSIKIFKTNLVGDTFCWDLSLSVVTMTAQRGVILAL